MKQAIFQNKFAQIGMAIGGILLVFILFAPMFSPYSPNVTDDSNKLQKPSFSHPFGTDQHGRDVLTRVAVGGRRSLVAAFVVISLTLVISLFIGILIGITGGLIDSFVMRICDVLLAFPQIVLALAIVGMLGVGFQNLLLALVISSLAYYIRLVRSFAISMKDRADIITARLAGISWTRIILTHITPHIFRQMLVIATLDLGGIIINIAGLSFLGFGTQPPDADWGAMLEESRFYFTTSPHLLIFPALAILLTIVSANLIGNAFREIEDIN